MLAPVNTLGSVLVEQGLISIGSGRNRPKSGCLGSPLTARNRRILFRCHTYQVIMHLTQKGGNMDVTGQQYVLCRVNMRGLRASLGNVTATEANAILEHLVVLSDAQDDRSCPQERQATEPSLTSR